MRGVINPKLASQTGKIGKYPVIGYVANGPVVLPPGTSFLTGEEIPYVEVKKLTEARPSIVGRLPSGTFLIRSYNFGDPVFPVPKNDLIDRRGNLDRLQFED